MTTDELEIMRQDAETITEFVFRFPVVDTCFGNDNPQHDAARRLRAMVNQLQAEPADLATVTRQRDELLAACRELVDMFSGLSETEDQDAAIKDARSAIAACGEK